jgi:hypothetical protein
LQGRNRRHAGLPIARHGRISAVPRTDFHPFSHPENDMVLVTRRFLLGALPSTIVLATLPALPALAATPGLTTHMLDTMNGIPAEGVRIDFSVLEADVYRLIATMRTNATGARRCRCSTPRR